MPAHPSLLRLLAALAATFAAAAMLAGSAPAATSEAAQDAGPTPPEVGQPDDDGVEDAGPTPSEIGEPSDGEESGAADTAGSATGGGRDDRPQDGSGLAVGGGEAGAQGAGAVTSVSEVPLARTGFPALALAALGGASVLAGLGLAGRRQGWRGGGPIQRVRESSS